MNVFKRLWTYVFNRVEHNPIEPGDEGLGSPATRVDVHSAQGDRSFEIVGGDRARDLPAKSASKSVKRTYPAKPKSTSRKKSAAKKTAAKKKSR